MWRAVWCLIKIHYPPQLKIKHYVRPQRAKAGWVSIGDIKKSEVGGDFAPSYKSHSRCISKGNFFFISQIKNFKWSRCRERKLGARNSFKIRKHCLLIFFSNFQRALGTMLDKVTMALSCPCSWKTQRKAKAQVPTWSAQPGYLQISQYALLSASTMPQVCSALRKRDPLPPPHLLPSYYLLFQQ